MNGTLKKIEITDDLIMKIARDQFSTYNKGILDEKREHIRVDWIKDAEDMLNNFNELVDIFKKINFQCDIDNVGCGWRDVEEFYRD